MDEDSDKLVNFESIFKNSKLSKQQMIYAEVADVGSSRLSSRGNYTPKDVLSNVSKQLNALQKADVMKTDKNRLRFKHVVKSALEPVNLLTLDKNGPPQSCHKFETQGVSDTQLLNIVVNAEILATLKGATQEFENSFCEHHIKKKKNSPNMSPDTIKKETNLAVNRVPNSLTILEDQVPIISKICQNKEKHNTNFSEINMEINKDLDPKSITLSPIIACNEYSQHPGTSLIYPLDAFENFETLAFPVIEQNPDVHLAKAIINSQIVDKELCITTHNPIISRQEGSTSPILTNRMLESTKNNEVDFDKIAKEPDKVTIKLKETKPKKSFEEDIFCSDEENSQEGNFRELPETCVLENSLSNLKDVLDKTMYVGFQTASNKSIQILTDSFCKAQNILELDDCKFDLKMSELIEICDETSKNKTSVYGIDVSKPASEIETAQLIVKDIFDTKVLKTNANINSSAKEHNIETEEVNLEYYDGSKEIIDKPINTIALVGFRTASRKKINLSDKALARCREVFQDINLDEVYDTTETSDVNALEQNIDGANEIKTTYSDKHKEEFLEVSEQIALNDETILQEFENDLLAPSGTDPEKRQQEVKSEYHIENKKIGLNKSVIEDNEPEKEISSRNSGKLGIEPQSVHVNNDILVGFKTANNEKIKISDHAIAKTKNIFEDFNISNDEVDNQIRKDESLRDVQTHKNTEVNNYQNNITSTLNALDNNNTGLQPNMTCGFVTANKKPIVISSEAFIKSRKVFEDIDSCVKGEIEMPEKIDSTPNKHVKNCKENNRYFEGTIKFENLAVKDELLYMNNNNYMSNKFKEPSNNQIKISDNVCNKGKLLEDLLHDIGGSSEAKGNKAVENNQSKEINISNQAFKGFKTASNKQVKVSEKSLASSRKLFKDLQINENSNNCNDDNILKEKQTKLTSKVHESNVQTEIRNGFNGFRSASNKVIEISEGASAKSKNLFLDLDINNDIDEQNKKSTESKDYNLSNTEVNYKNKNDKNLNENTVNLKNYLRYPKEEFQDHFPSIKRIKVSQDSDQENKQIPLENASVENLTATINTKASTNFSLLFKTANDTNVKISEDALLQTKGVLRDFNQNDQVIETNFQTTIRKNEGNIENILDTQLLKNFEDTLFTEDFCKEVPNKKRCGSPILSCPRAKKSKRFEVPYKKWETPKINPKATDTLEANRSVMFEFDKNYKKNNKQSLKSLKDIEVNKPVVEVDPYIIKFNFENTLHFEFSSRRNEINNEIWGTEDLKKCFLSLVNKKIIPDGWLDNHLKLIIFKLISYEKEYKYAMQGICSVKNVLEQLKYRYDRELYNVERPAFRKLLEKDDVPTKTMVLRVVAIYVDGVITESMPDTSNIELFLTDGWYCIKARVDRMLCRLVRDQKIRVGTKLVTNGAELLNCEQGISPWEDTSSVRLKIFGNSTRRARSDAKLGYHSGAAILSRLSSVQLEGGKVSKLRALVTRVYPMLYVEKFDDGSRATRSERLEHLCQVKFESDRQTLLEKIYEEVQKEFVYEESQDTECELDIRNVETGSQIYRLMKRTNDSEEFVENLTSSQCNTLQRYTERRRERMLEALQARVTDRVKEQGLQVGRNVVPVMKIRVSDVGEDGEISKAMMSIWRPNEAVMDIIKEGTWIDAFNIVPTARRFSEIQLSAGRQTVFSRSNYKVNDKVQQIVASLKRTCYNIESLVKMPSAVIDYDEIDLVGLVFLIEPSIPRFEITKGQHFQNVYLTDTDKNIICVNFWGGLKKFGHENIIDIGLVVACINLQKRTGNARKGIPQFRATEYTYFTKTSKHPNVRMIMDDLNKKLTSINIKQLCESCVAIKNNNTIVKTVENISPYRINYSDYNISKHKAFIDSPLARKPEHDDILNLSGLDFESTFKQIDTQDMSTDLLLRKKKVNEKMAKLKMYGEPPPLKAIHIINKSKNATNVFKSPLASRSDSSNGVASEKLHEKPNSAIDCHMKRMYANPVKLNFCSRPNETGGENFDPFAEEFDLSQPLSLD